MVVRTVWLWASLLLATSAAAEECRRDFKIESTDDTGSLFDNCTTIVGNIDLGDRFKGPIIMGDVVNITGILTLGTEDRRQSIVHRVEAPVLEYLGGLVIVNTKVGEVSLPKLKNVTGEMSISPANVGGSKVEMQFPALQEAGGIDIGLGDYIYGSGSFSLTSLGVDLASLRSAEYIRLWGYLNSLNMSELTTVGLRNGETKHTDRSGLEIQLAEKADGLNVTLPKLESIESNLTLSGKIREAQLDSLTKTSANITIDTSYPLDLSLPLIEAETITLNGTINYASFPDIQRLKSITVTTVYDDFDCDGFKEQLSQASSHPGSISCTAGSPSKRLSSGEKIALSVIIPIVMVIAATFIALVLRRRRSRKNKESMAASGREGPPPYNMAMRPLPPRKETAPPPPYSAS